MSYPFLKIAKLFFVAIAFIVVHSPVAHSESEYGLTKTLLDDTILQADQAFSYNGSPIKTSGFIIHPSLSLIQAYNDNVLAQNNDKKGDWQTTISGDINIAKPIGRHFIELKIKGSRTAHASLDEENVTKYDIAVRGNLEAKRSLSFPLEIQHISDVQDRGNMRVETLTQTPISFKETRVKAGAIYHANRLKLGVKGQYKTRQFDNNIFKSTNLTSIQSDRDLNIYEGHLETSYQLSSGWEPFISSTYSVNDYVHNEHDGTGFNGQTRDNRLIRGSIGTMFNFKGIVLGKISAGYEERNYKDQNLETSKGLTLSANTEWSLTQKTKFKLALKQRNIDTNMAGFQETVGSGEIFHELQHHLFARSGIKYGFSDFNHSNRKDHFLKGNIGLQYIISPKFQIGFDYTHSAHNSNNNEFDFQQNLFLVRLTGSL